MLKKILFLLALLPLAGVAAPETSLPVLSREEPHPEKWPQPLHVEERDILTPQGEKCWLQGVNVSGMETNSADKHALQSVLVAVEQWKASVIRLPVKEEFWFGRHKAQKDGGAAYRDMVDQAILIAANRGAYLVLDLHRFGALKMEHLEFWQEIARRYRNHPALLFDIINEPHDISWDLWKNGGFVSARKGKADEDAFLSASEIQKAKTEGFESPGMQRVIDAIRAEGAKNVVVAAGLGWSGDLSGITRGYALSDEDGSGIVYSWHIYNWHTGWKERVMDVIDKYPVLVGEVGADVKKMPFVPEADQEDPYTWVPDILGFIQKHRLNWTAWCMHPRATPVLIQDWDYTPTPFWGVFAKDALAGKQFELKRLR